MNATINTDASYNDEFKCGAFAFWMVCDNGKYQKAGELKGEIISSQHAEMACIANALHTLKTSKWSGLKKIIINTDSECSIKIIKGDNRGFKQPSARAVTDEVRVLMFELCLKYGFGLRDLNKFIELRHVKAHTKNKDARSVVNKWCDKEAGKYLSQIIKRKLIR